MPKAQFNVRIDDATRRKIEILRDEYDSYSKVIAVAVDRLYQDKLRLKQEGAKMNIVIKFSDDSLWGDTDPRSENIDVSASVNKYKALVHTALKTAYAATIEMIHGISDSHAVNGQEDHEECDWIGEIIHNVWKSWDWIVKYPTTD